MSENLHVSLQEAAVIAATARLEGKIVGLCHGVFDLLHPGHFRHVSSASRQVDVLFVSITGDDFVNKGPGRPIFSQNLRAEALTSLKGVDFVVISPEATALTVLRSIRPNVYFKGQDYANATDDPTGKIREECAVVESYGGRTEFTNEIVFSSSNLINRHMSSYSGQVQEWLAKLRPAVSPESVCAYLDGISSLRVTVIGEAILDTYTTCEALGKASKEPVLCMRMGKTVTHAGGSLAVAANARGLGATVNLVTGFHSSTLQAQEVHALMEAGVSVHAVQTDPAPTIRKVRIVDEQTRNRVLELYEMDDSPLIAEAEDRLLSMIDECALRSDVIILVDYGHGLLSERVINHVCSLGVFLAINAQANAGNHGFNSLARYPRADFAALNGGEARLDARRRHVDLDQYVPALRERLSAGAVLVTQGGSGTLLYMKGGDPYRAPALASFVNDRVGAGDALLTGSSLLMYLGAPAPVISLVANVVGAWAVSFLGNEQTLELGSLKRQVTSILK